ncbi:MAG: HAD-IC family P-type ATPase [Candidatus Cloacimonetes bacterium]|nr:HAD-IC family P-type ATPase [Candidatus Cloacimonadota bacterium]
MGNFKSFTGKGVRAEIGGTEYYLGSAAFLEENRIVIAHPQVENLSNGYNYASRVFLADKHKVLGVFLIADTLKPEAAEVVKGLRDKGIRTIMISGDNRQTAAAIAAQAGIDEFIAEVMPADKAQHVKDLQAKYGCVAMVGDGINDAPALKQADIGIALGQGTDIAIETADITIVRSDLQTLLAAVNLSVMTFGKIKQNLFWAFFYNLVAIPLAVFGLLHPVIAEIAMATSSITVVTNANLPRWVAEGKRPYNKPW